MGSVIQGIDCRGVKRVQGEKGVVSSLVDKQLLEVSAAPKA